MRIVPSFAMFFIPVLLGCLPFHFRDVDSLFGHFVKRGKLAELGDDLHHLVDDVVDFLLRVEASEAEANRGVGEVFADAYCFEYVARLQGCRRTGGTAGNRDVVDAHEERFAFDVGKAHVQVVGQAVLHRAVDENLVELGFQALAETLAQGEHTRRLFRHLFLRDFASLAEAHDAGNIQGAGTHAALVAAAVDDGGKLHAGIAAADVQSANALGPVNFVAAHGQQVDVVFLHIDGNLAHSLHAVHGEEDAVLLGKFADFRDRVNYANFVVGVHDGDQNRCGLNGRLQLLNVYAPVALDRQIGDFEAVLFEVLAGVQHGLVLDGLGDDVVALFAEHLRDALDHQVIGFGSAAGEDDFLGRGVDQRSNLLTRRFHGLFAGPAEGVVAAGGVAELLGEVRQHRFDDARIDRRGRMIVHVNRQLDGHIPSSPKSLTLRVHARAALRSFEKS